MAMEVRSPRTKLSARNPTNPLASQTFIYGLASRRKFTFSTGWANDPRGGGASSRKGTWGKWEMEKWCPELSGSVATQSNAVYRHTGFHFLCFSAFWQFSYTCEWRYSDAFRHFGPTYIIVWPANQPACFGRLPYSPPCRTIHKKNSGIPKTDSRRVEFNLPPFSDL